MAQTDLKKLSLSELKSLQKKVERAIASHEKRARKDALAAIKDKAKQLGYSLNELVGEGAPEKGRAGKPRKAPAAPKYRHPTDAALTWSGRGRKPKWIKKAAAEGVDIETLRISS